MLNRRFILTAAGGLLLSAPPILKPGIAMPVFVPKPSRWDRLRASNGPHLIDQAWRGGVLVASHLHGEDSSLWPNPPAGTTKWHRSDGGAWLCTESNISAIKRGEFATKHRADFIVVEETCMIVEDWETGAPMEAHWRRPKKLWPASGSWADLHKGYLFDDWHGPLA